MNRIVARFQDGHVLKGYTNDFLPAKDRFHLFEGEPGPGIKPLEVKVADLKALFFVKTFEGNKDHPKTNTPEHESPVVGRRIRVVFNDGEVIVGKTQGYDKNRPGFFIVPVDPESNNERCYVVSAAAKEVTFVQA